MVAATLDGAHRENQVESGCSFLHQESGLSNQESGAQLSNQESGLSNLELGGSKQKPGATLDGAHRENQVESGAQLSSQESRLSNQESGAQTSNQESGLSNLELKQKSGATLDGAHRENQVESGASTLKPGVRGLKQSIRDLNDR